MTSDDISSDLWLSIALGSSQVGWDDMFPKESDGLGQFIWNRKHLHVSPLTYNGEVAKLTWPQVTDIKNPKYTNCWYPCPLTICQVWNLSDKNSGLDTIANIFGGRVTKLDLVTWPDVTWGQNFNTESRIDVREGMQNFAALRAAVFSPDAKNRRGGQKWPPPPGRRLIATKGMILLLI